MRPKAAATGRELRSQGTALTILLHAEGLMPELRILALIIDLSKLR